MAVLEVADRLAPEPVGIAAAVAAALWIGARLVRQRDVTASVRFDPGRGGDQLCCVDAEDGSTLVVERGGEPALSTDRAGSPRRPYLYFRLDRRLAGRLRRAHTLLVAVVHDASGASAVRLEYDARQVRYRRAMHHRLAAGTLRQGARGPEIQLPATAASDWRTSLFELADPRLRGGEKTADFRIANEPPGEREIRVRSIRLIAVGG